MPTALAAGPSDPSASIAARQVTLTPTGGDDAPQIQSAIDSLATSGGGDVILAPGGSAPFRVGSTVLLPRDSARGGVVNIRALGKPVITPLNGPLDGGLLRATSAWGYTIEGLTFQGSGRSGVGLWLAAESGSGTRGGQAIVSRVNVSGFASGVRVGTSSGTAASEILFLDCAAYSCSMGFELLNYNTLDLAFVMLSLGQNDYGIFTKTASEVTIWGGSASDSAQADFHFGTGGVFSIQGFRSEGARCLFEPGTTTATTQVTLVACDVEAGTDPDGYVLRGNWGDTLTVIGCDLAGKIGWGQVHGYTVPSPGRLVMLGSTVQDTQPFRPVPDGESLPFTVLGCKSRNPDNTVGPLFADMTGCVQGGVLVATTQATPDGKLGFFGADGVARPVITGSRGSGAALDSLISALASLGLVTDSTTK